MIGNRKGPIKSDVGDAKFQRTGRQDRPIQKINPEKTTAFIGIGANLGDREANLASAAAALASSDDCEHVVCASVYETAPMGPQDQPHYLNTVVRLETRLSAHELLALTQSIENDHGRTRDGEVWGPRTLDLDILLFGEIVIDTEDLKVPHPGIPTRSFVLQPLRELAPDLIIPGQGPIDELVESCRQFDIRRLNSPI